MMGFTLTIFMDRWQRAKSVVIFGVDMSSSMHIDNKNILILGEGPTPELGDTTSAAGAKYPINFKQSGKRFALSLHYNGSNSFLFVNATKIYQFNTKDSEIKPCPLCLYNISKDFALNNIKKETGLKGIVKVFSVDYNSIDTIHDLYL